MKIPKFDYEPTFPNVHGIHIGITVALVVIAYYFFFGGLPGSNLFAGPRVENGNGASAYVSTRSVEGWEAVQYHALGAYAGALTGESD